MTLFWVSRSAPGESFRLWSLESMSICKFSVFNESCLVLSLSLAKTFPIIASIFWILSWFFHANVHTMKHPAAVWALCAHVDCSLFVWPLPWAVIQCLVIVLDTKVKRLAVTCSKSQHYACWHFLYNSQSSAWIFLTDDLKTRKKHHPGENTFQSLEFTFT